ncbi:MAG: hypothetical protein M0R00_01345 [Candidatus Omnitrophica bacterium]|jgi:hypothetical protein|nr:hypothetical protein [Candidatus Omnitrophota bacterium]
MKTKIRITHRPTGVSAHITWAWGAKTVLTGYATKEDAQKAAEVEINKKRQYTLDRDI